MFADEGATLYSGRLPWSDLWAQSQHVDLVLLPYYVLIHFWMLVSGNILWVRALSLLAFFGTILVIGWTGLRIAGRWCGIIASVLTATSALLVEKSLNARPYELSSFVVVLCAVVLFRWLEDSRARWLWAFSVLAVLATAMQLFSLLAPIAMLLGVLVVRPELIADRLRVLFAPVAFLAVVSCAWVVACSGEVGQVNWIANESTGSRLLAEVRGPGVGQFYDFVLIVIAVVVMTRLAVVWNGGGRDAIVERVSHDRDFLALTAAWALVPTLVLSLVSFVHPIFSVRYVTASAPGVALLSAFVLVRAFPRTLDPARYPDGTTAHRKMQIRAMAAVGVAATVLLAIGYFGTASAQQEDLQGPAQYAVQHSENGDVIALPDHAITSAVRYYLTNGTNQLRLWPQLGVRQRYVEGLDLSLHPSGALPRRVWLVNDGSVSGVRRFESILIHDGYEVRDFKQFNGSSVVLYYRPTPTTSLPPSKGATLRGSAALLVAYVNPHGTKITKVQFVLSGNGYHKAVIGTASYTKVGEVFVWNTITVPNGSYSLQSLVTSSTGTMSYSAPISVRVDN